MSLDDNLDRAVGAVLDTVEDRESQLLSWGLTTGHFSYDELEGLTDGLLTGLESDGLLTPDEVIEALVDRALLVRGHGAGGETYRTRMAEGVALLARLRQLFPRHIENLAWQSAPTLVADFRFAVVPRRYPRRNIRFDDALNTIGDSVNIGAQRQAALAALIEAQGNPDMFRLAQFQVDATAAILRSLNGNRTTGTLVGAGTGSGKTLAFYLPALAHVAALIDRTNWTKALAVYPRRELLADQATETFIQTRRLAAHQATVGKRRILIGTFYGDTPPSSKQIYWPHAPGGRVCPFLRCPRCGSRMLWRDEDIHAATESLTCEDTGCGERTHPDEFALTRDRLQREPPDVLFTTTEMLNRQLSNSYTQHIFGVGAGARRKPELMLLDEVHTYEGVHGAQVALLLRRWRHACRRPVQFVGLSATLREPETFFADLIGVDRTDVLALEPKPEEMIAEGREYLLALRGDPVSGTSLLSTTIQTAMLLRRLLDPTTEGIWGRYGSTVFLFTDDLDVTNRMFFNLQDAEALDSFGKPLDQRPAGSLANLRASTQPDLPARRADGQAWTVCEEIGHPLTPGHHLEIGRTSSQDAGVKTGADIVVATASLEVGFNDPTVGAIIQHKAPHDSARFLQRKGRAGRRRTMRPWTTVVLSDYGRDRLAYQSYDQLFDPIIDKRSLPISNRYVQRIQATEALIDWLHTQIDGPRGHMRTDLAAPAAGGAEKRQGKAQQVIHAVLTQPSRQQDLAEHLERALRITPADVAALMWEPPRALMTAVLPTALRRLSTRWRRVRPDGGRDTEHHDKQHPLPEFLPTTLFSDLMLPELEIELPADRSAEARSEWMPIGQAMREFAPGRVSRRFGVRHQYLRHWVPVPVDGTNTLSVRTFVTDAEELGQFTSMDGDAVGETVRCLRPRTITPLEPERRIRDTSYATLRWNSQILAAADGVPLDAPYLERWERLAPTLEFFLSNRYASAIVRRFATGSDASIVFDGGGEQAVGVDFVEDETAEPIALGYALDVDAVRLRIRPPSDLLATLEAREPAAARSFRTRYFEEQVRNSPELTAFANEFQRGWLAEVFLSALLARAMVDHSTIEAASAELRKGDPARTLSEALATIFQTLPTDDESDDADGDRQGDAGRQRLHTRLDELFKHKPVLDTLFAVAPSLWKAFDEAAERWAGERFASTLAAATVEASQRLCPEFDTGDLLIDPLHTEATDAVEIWISERTIGGGGVTEELHRRAAADPRRFFRLIESALGPSDLEVVDGEMTRLLSLLDRQPAIATAVEDVRAAPDHEALRTAFDSLLGVLDAHGILVTHPVLAAINARILRPGANPKTDDLLNRLIRTWSDHEERLGVELDARVVAYVASADDSLEHALARAPDVSGERRRQWRMNVLAGLLWARGGALRERALSTTNPFRALPPADRLLVLAAVGAIAPPIQLTAPDWRETLAERLRSEGSARVQANRDQRAQLADALTTILSRPIDFGHLHVYPRVEAIRRTPDGLEAGIDLREALQ